jgi:hypothetical protein
MESKMQKHRLVLRLGVMGLVLAACIGFGVALGLAPPIEQYPGSTLISDSTTQRFQPNYFTRRTAVYKSQDAFNKVYGWYSIGFKLGPEAHAQGNCILMARSSTLLLFIDETMSVTLCDTPTGAMAFVMHTRYVRYAGWLRGLGL